MKQNDHRKVALVSGGNRGIGAEICRQLALSGHIVVAGIRSTNVPAWKASGGGLGGVVHLDVTNPSSVAAAVATVLEERGRIDILVNNAGAHYDVGVAPSEVTDADARDALDVNLLGPWRLTRAVMGEMRTRGWGRIVNVSSRAGSFSLSERDAPAYSVSKAALNMLTLLTANELRESGVLVNACCPGWARTQMGGEQADRSVEEAACTPVWLSTLPNTGPTGKFFAEGVEIPW